MLQYCFCFMFWFFDHKACGILAPQPWIEPAPPTLDSEVLTTGPPGKFLTRPLTWLACYFCYLGHSYLNICMAGPFLWFRCQVLVTCYFVLFNLPAIWNNLVYFLSSPILLCLERWLVYWKCSRRCWNKSLNKHQIAPDQGDDFSPIPHGADLSPHWKSDMAGTYPKHMPLSPVNSRIAPADLRFNHLQGYPLVW